MSNPLWTRNIGVRYGVATAAALAGITVVAVLGLWMGGCATLKELAALRKVGFAFDRVSDVALAGVRLDTIRRYSELSASDAAGILSAVTSQRVPLDLVVHVRAENPKENSVQARLVDLQWKFFVDDRQAIEGRFSGEKLLPPGTPVDIPVSVRFDALEFFHTGARDLFEAALAIGGWGSTTKPIRLEVVPTISTELGPISYPAPIVLRR